MELVHAYAVAGHNCPPDDDVPPKGQRIVDEARARQLLIAARQIKALFHVPLNRIMEKRKGGEDGRALRRFLIYYARGLGSPVWECAKIFDLDRKQIGQEEDAYLTMLARNADLEEDVENMTALCDSAVRVDCGRFIRVSLTEIQADAAARKAIKEAREASKRLALAEPPKPKKKAPTEAERVQAEANAKHKAEALRGQIAIARAVIEKAKGPKATKEQRKDAERAERELNELEAKLKKGRVKG